MSRLETHAHMSGGNEKKTPLVSTKTISLRKRGEMFCFHKKHQVNGYGLGFLEVLAGRQGLVLESSYLLGPATGLSNL